MILSFKQIIIIIGIFHLQRQVILEFLIHYWLHQTLCLDCRCWCSSQAKGNLVDQADESGLMH